MEMIVVIAISGIVLVIAAPNFTRYRDNKNLKEAARDLSSDIQLYKQRAVAENAPYTITFNSGTNDYVIMKGAVLVATKQVGVGNANVRILGTPSFSGGVPTITLLPRGTSTNGSLTLQHTTRLSEAQITANIMGRTHVDYTLK